MLENIPSNFNDKDIPEEYKKNIPAANMNMFNNNLFQKKIKGVLLSITKLLPSLTEEETIEPRILTKSNRLSIVSNKSKVSINEITEIIKFLDLFRTLTKKQPEGASIKDILKEVNG